MTNNQRATAADESPRPDGQPAVLPSLDDAIVQYQRPLLRYVMGILKRSPDLAQDVVQDTFLRYNQARQDGMPVRNVSSWLFRVAHNLAVDLYRRNHRTCLLDDATMHADTLHESPAIGARTLPPGAPMPGVELGRRETHDLALAELQRLPEELREVLLLKVLEGRTLAEVGEITGLKIGTVHYRLCQGLKELTRRLQAQGAL